VPALISSVAWCDLADNKAHPPYRYEQYGQNQPTTEYLALNIVETSLARPMLVIKTILQGPWLPVFTRLPIGSLLEN
jgi:hypothetical protein